VAHVLTAAGLTPDHVALVAAPLVQPPAYG